MAVVFVNDIRTYSGSGTQLPLGPGDFLAITRNGGLINPTSNIVVSLNGANDISIEGFISSYGVGLGLIGSTTADGATVRVAASASISSGVYAINLSGSNLRVTNAGHLASPGFTVINYGNNASFSNTGVVSGGVALSGAGSLINNDGQINSTTAAILTQSGSASIGNSGSLSSTGTFFAAVSFYADGRLTNSGTISGAFGGVANVGSNATMRIENTGTITDSGTTGAIKGGSGADVVVNAGRIVGAVNLGGGADVFDNTGGLVTGSVAGGQGADVLTGGAARDVFYGDNLSGDTSGGADTLSGGFGDDVLNGGYGADTLFGNQDNDVLSGNQDNDVLHGGLGDDVLFGGQGNDTLNGGKGEDTLTGNLGDDLFVFSSAFGHDVVTDFRAGGANDIIQFSPDTFGSFAAVQAGATAVTNGTLLTDAAGDTVLITGIAPGALTAAMFVFA